MAESTAAEKGLLKILERLPVATVITRLDTGLVQWVNTDHLALVRATDPSQVVGHSIIEFIPPDQHGVALRDIEAIATKGISPPPVTYASCGATGAPPS